MVLSWSPAEWDDIGKAGRHGGAGSFRRCEESRQAGATAWLAYALMAAGWILTTTVLAGITRTLNRN